MIIMSEQPTSPEKIPPIYEVFLRRTEEILQSSPNHESYLALFYKLSNESENDSWDHFRAVHAQIIIPIVSNLTSRNSGEECSQAEKDIKAIWDEIQVLKEKNPNDTTYN